MIFDECHHTADAHPMNYILKEFYYLYFFYEIYILI